MGLFFGEKTMNIFLHCRFILNLHFPWCWLWYGYIGLCHKSSWIWREQESEFARPCGPHWRHSKLILIIIYLAWIYIYCCKDSSSIICVLNVFVHLIGHNWRAWYDTWKSWNWNAWVLQKGGNPLNSLSSQRFLFD